MLLIIIVAIVIGVIFLLSKFTIGYAEASKVTVYLDDKMVDKLSLYEDVEKTYSSEYGENTISINKGELRVIHSDCKNKICVDSSSISKNGEMIVCLPHHFYVEIIGKEEDEIDAIAK